MKEFDQYARDAMAPFLGKVIRYFVPKEKEFEQYKELRKQLTADDMNQLIIAYEIFDDCQINETLKFSRLEYAIPGIISVLKKTFKFAYEHKMLGEDWDLISVAEAILDY